MHCAPLTALVTIALLIVIMTVSVLVIMCAVVMDAASRA